MQRELTPESQNDDHTKITYCTTGVILQRLIHGKSLARYTHIIIDEVHDRDIDIDFLLIIVRRMMANAGVDTKIILMSATMNAPQFLNYFKIPLQDGFFTPPVIDLLSSARVYPIRNFFLTEFEGVKFDGKMCDLINYNDPNISDEMYEFASRVLLVCLLQIRDTAKTATILVFLPGLYEIETFRNKIMEPKIQQHLKKKDISAEVYILHSMLSTEEQRNAIKVGDKFKIILATNIAESSVTIPNVTTVIDFCLTKNLETLKGSSISSLVLSWASRNNCKQRAGRSGRVCPGVVVRLVEKEFFYHRMQEYPTPEMMRVSLESVIVRLKVLDMGSPMQMLSLALDPPDASSIVDAVLHLKEAGALLRYDAEGNFNYEDGEITFLGRVMASMPVDIGLVRLIVIGYMMSLLDDAIIIAAGLSLKSIFTQSFDRSIINYLQKVRWAHGSASDCIALLNAYKLFIKYDSESNSSNWEDKNWCNHNRLELKNLREMQLLVGELKQRLEQFNIVNLPENQPIWDEREKPFMLKICIAGGFGATNFFMPEDNRCDYERDVCKILNGKDLNRTVYFKNMDRNLFGNVYDKQLAQTLKQKLVVDDVSKVTCEFDYKIAEKVYVTFDNDLQLLETLDDENEHRDDKHNSVTGKILPEVYKAVKLRQVDRNLTLHVMGYNDTLKWAEQRGFGKVCNQHSFTLSTNYIECPEWCVLPTSCTQKIRGYVTHIDNPNKFMFHPLVTFGNNFSFEYYKQIDEVIEQTIKELFDKSLALCVAKHDVALVPGQLLIAFIDDRYVRVKLIRQINQKCDIYLMDYGSTQWNFNTKHLYVISCKEFESDLARIPPRCFVCTLQEIRPATMKSIEGKWTQDAVRKFNELVNKKSTIYVHSVVDDVVSVQLSSSKVNWNQKLIAEGYAEECEESYLSRINYMERKQHQNRCVTPCTPAQEFAQKVEKHNRCNESPPLVMCHKKLVLQGPFSPLEMKLKGSARAFQGEVTIENTSVNSVLLNDDIHNFHSKFCVASSITVSFQRGVSLTIRETTMMPNIVGLAPLLAMIFSPTAELRRDEKKTRFVSVLKGLGFDKELGKPYFGEHDASFNVDFVLSKEDVVQINQLRACLSHMLLTKPSKTFPELVDAERAETLSRIQSVFIDLLKKTRPLLETCLAQRQFNWNEDQEDVVKLIEPHKNRNIFSVLPVPPLHQVPTLVKNDLLKYIAELKLCATGNITIYNRCCKLCNVEWQTQDDLKLHLMSKMHINRCAQVDIM